MPNVIYKLLMENPRGLGINLIYCFKKCVICLLCSPKTATLGIEPLSELIHLEIGRNSLRFKEINNLILRKVLILF